MCENVIRSVLQMNHNRSANTRALPASSTVISVNLLGVLTVKLGYWAPENLPSGQVGTGWAKQR